MHKGILYAASAFFIWGLFPLYFKLLKQIPSAELLLHRILWSLLFLTLILAWRKQWAWLGQLIHQPRVLARFLCSALLLSGNWLLYIWAVNNDRVIDSSLGYFINPLVNVLLGYLLLKERLRVGQWSAVGLAACGVLWLTWQAGQLPWIALTLACTFGTYGLLRKTATLGPLEGLSIETLLLSPLTIGYLIWLIWHQEFSFIHQPLTTQGWLILAGPITAIPLLLFAAGARRIPLSLLGMLQYIGPSLQLLIGVMIYHEPFGWGRMCGFVIIWSALALYSLEGLWHNKTQAAQLS
jgi:chloramphenicol-sensitive protein RarD